MQESSALMLSALALDHLGAQVFIVIFAVAQGFSERDASYTAHTPGQHSSPSRPPPPGTSGGHTTPRYKSASGEGAGARQSRQNAPEQEGERTGYPTSVVRSVCLL